MAPMIQPPNPPQQLLTASQLKALQIVSSPDLLDSLTESQKVTLLLDLSMGQQTKIEGLVSELHAFRVWVERRFYVAAVSGALGGAGIGYGGTKALAAVLPFFM